MNPTPPDKHAMFGLTGLSPQQFRNHAVRGMHHLLGGPVEPVDLGFPASIVLPAMNLIVAAGDQQVPLDPRRFRSAAVVQGTDLVALYVDAFKRGHPVLFDLIVQKGGQARRFDGYRLWITEAGAMSFIPNTGDGDMIAILPFGLTVTEQLPFADKLQRAIGIARAQARLIDLIWGGSPFGGRGE